MAIGCLAFIQFLLIGIVKVSFNCSKYSIKARFTVKYISRSGFHVHYMPLRILTRSYSLPECHNYTKCSYLVTCKGDWRCLLVCCCYKCIVSICSWANLEELFVFLHLKWMVLCQSYCYNDRNHSFL